jgi:hypothetical protein
VPAKEIFGAFWHIRDHLEQHDGFVEMIQIVGGKPGAGIDIGGPQFGSPCPVVAANLAGCQAIGDCGIGGL